MYLIEKRTNSISIADKDMQAINDQIELFYQKTGNKPQNISQLFKALLSFAMAANITGEEKNTIPSFELDVEHQALMETISHAREKFGLPVESLDAVVITNALDKSLNPPEPEVIEKTVEVEKEVEAAQPSNQVRFDLTDNELVLVQTISERRFAKRKADSIQSPSEICKQLAFNNGTILNLSGEFYTGVR